MPLNTLEVPRGETLPIDLTNAAKLGAQVTSVRPRTIAALKAATRLRRAAGFSFADRELFEEVREEKRKNMIQFSLDRDGRIGGIRGRQLLGMLAAVPDDAMQMPDRVTVVQRPRSRDEWRAGIDEWRPHRDYRELLERLRTVRSLMLDVPKWLREFHIFFVVLSFEDLIVGENATLVIGAGISGVLANNIYMYQGARIDQKAEALSVTVHNEIKGVAA